MIGFNLSGLQLIVQEIEEKKTIKEFKSNYSKKKKSKKKSKVKQVIQTPSKFVDDAPVMMI